MKKFLCASLSFVLLLIIALPAGAADESKSFSDIAKHWAKDTFLLAVEKGYVSGYPNGTFQPNKQVTRAEFIKMLVDALKLPHSLEGKPWYQPYVAAAIETGFHKEKDFNTDYNKPLTRMEMARIAVRGIDPSGLFEDEQWMVYATEKGVIHGMGNGELNPEGLSTRAQAVAVIERILAVRQGENLPVDQMAIDAAKQAAYNQNLFKFGFTDIVKLPVTVEDPSGFKVTIHSIYAYDKEGSKPFVDKYDLTMPKNRDKQQYNQVPLYESDEFANEYTFFFINITLRNNGKKDVALDFYDLEPKYSVTSATTSPKILSPNYLSIYREGSNRTDYTYTYRIKPGSSFNTNQAVVFRKGELNEALYFNAMNAFVTLAKIPNDKAW